MKSTLSFLFVLAAGMLQAAFVWKPDSAGGSGGWGDATRWEGDATPTANAEVEIPAGEATVEDADVSLYQSLAKVTLTDADSKLVFKDATLTEPFVKDGFLCGSVGTVVKDNSINWRLSVSSATYTGAFDIKQGKVSMANANGLGSPTSGTLAKPGRAIYIRSGAQITAGSELSSPNNFTFGFRPLHIAGNGGDGNGAFYLDKGSVVNSGLMRIVVLEDDASVGSKADTYLGIADGTVDFNGNHTLSTAADFAYYLRVADTTFFNSVEGAKGVLEIGTGSETKVIQLAIMGSKLSFGNTDAVTVRLVNCGRVKFRGDSDQHARPECPLVVASENATFENWNYPDTPGKLARADWAGPVTIQEGAKLTHIATRNERRADNTRISGKISGAGEICVPETDRAQFQLLNAANDFTGDITVNGLYGGSLKVFHPGTVASAGNFKLVNGGVITLVGKNWSLDDITPFSFLPAYEDVANSGYGMIAIDPEGCGDSDTLALALKDGDIRFKTNSEGVSGGLGVDGIGTLEITNGGLDEDRMRLGAYAGTLRLKNGPFKTGIVLATSHGDSSTGIIEVVDAAIDITNGHWMAGYVTSSQGGDYGIIRLRNAKIMNHHSTTFMENEGFCIGRYARGDLYIEDGCAVTSRLTSAWGQTSGRARIIQNGGYFHAWGAENSLGFNGLAIIGYSGAAHYELNDGTFAFNGNVVLGYDNGGSGAFYQHGGVITNTVVDKGTIFAVGCHFGRSQGAVSGIYYNDGGRFVSTSGSSVFTMSRLGSGKEDPTHSVAAVDSPNAYVSFNNVTLMGGSTNSVSILDLNNGGTWRTWRVQKRQSAPDYYRACVNFDGGELQTTSGSYVFGCPTDLSRLSVDTVTVFAGGATVNTSARQTILVPLEAPTGYGVKSVDWTLTSTKFPCAPTVVITDSGSGYGASAVAIYDAKTERVTGIKVLSPGCNYTKATAAVRWGGGYVVNVGCTLAANDTTGGVTFKTSQKSSTLAIEVANTYNGETSIAGVGTVVVSNSCAFGNSKVLSLANGTLNLGGYTLGSLGIEKIHFQGGQVTADSLPVTLPDGCEYLIDLTRAIANGKYVVPTNVECPGDIAFTLLNGDQADRAVGRYALITVPSAFAGIPAVSGVPTNWTLRRVGNDIVMTWRHPMSIILR